MIGSCCTCFQPILSQQGSDGVGVAYICFHCSDSTSEEYTHSVIRFIQPLQLGMPESQRRFRSLHSSQAIMVRLRVMDILGLGQDLSSASVLPRFCS